MLFGCSGTISLEYCGVNSAMDPMTTNVFYGVLANALTATAGSIIRGARAHLKQNAELLEKLRSHQPIVTIVQHSIVAMAKKIAGESPARADAIKRFLVSPELEAIVRDVYAYRLHGTTRQGMPEIERIFNSVLAAYLREGNGASTLPDGGFFHAVLDATDAAFDFAIENDVLAAHEAKSAARYGLLEDMLRGIQHKLDTLSDPMPALSEIETFERNVRSQVKERYGRVALQHIDSQRKVEIDRIYVAPEFRRDPLRQEGEPEVTAIEDLRFQIYRTVLLGNPGSGKSTLAAKLCHDVAAQHDERVVGGRHVTPILVVLREYGLWRSQSNSSSIVQFIEDRCLLQVPVLENAIEYLLLQGRLFVVFDGLDELLDTSSRASVRDDVESFCQLYPDVPVLVTSRSVGYEQAPLDVDRFCIFRIGEFSAAQVGEYAQKWFALDPDLSRQQQADLAEAFLRDSGIVPDLRANALMLALMCNLYHGERHIPRNRPDVYEKCATLLFEKWDPSRGLRVTLPFEAHVGPAIKHLAHWIYLDPTFQEGVTGRAIVDEATSYLCPRQFEDTDEARHAAQQFVDYCRGRAWVFTDTGTTADGEALYQFTHRTFLEYFTAAYLVRTNPTPDGLAQCLLDRIRSREWDVVAQLSFQIQAKNTESAADELLSRVLEDVSRLHTQERFNILSFAARSLEFLVPSPRVVREVVAQSLNFVLTRVDEADESPRKETDQSRIARGGSEELLGALLLSRIDNLRTIEKCTIDSLLRGIKGRDRVEAVRALDVAQSLRLAMARGAGSGSDTEQGKAGLALCDAVRHGVLPQIEQTRIKFAETSKRVCHECVCDGLLDVCHMARWHGIEALFAPSPHEVFSTWRTWSLEYWLIAVTIGRRVEKEDGSKRLWCLSQLEKFGGLVVSTPPPWAILIPQSHVLEWLFETHRDGERKPSGSWDGSPDAFFGLVVAFAVALEKEILHQKRDHIMWARNQDYGLLMPFKDILFLRFAEERALAQNVLADGRREMVNAGFGEKQQALLIGWVRKELHFVEHKTEEGSALKQ